MIDRRAAVRALLADRGQLVCVAGLGGTSWDVAAAGDSDLDLPLWGSMGAAAMVGFGIALAQPDRPVLVVTGDGEQEERRSWRVHEDGGVAFRPVPGNALLWVNLLADGTGGDERVVHAGLPIADGVKYGMNIWPRTFFGPDAAL